MINGLIDLVEHFEEAAGRTFHLVSGDPSPIAALVALDYPGFHVPRLASLATFDPSQLDPHQAMIYESVTSHTPPIYAATRISRPRICAVCQGGFVRPLERAFCAGSWTMLRGRVIFDQT